MPGYAETPSGPPGTPPREVDWASKILFGLAGLGIINTIVSFTMTDEIRDIVRDENPDYSADKVDSAVNGILGFAVVFGIVFALIYAASDFSWLSLARFGPRTRKSLKPSSPFRWRRSSAPHCNQT